MTSTEQGRRKYDEIAEKYEEIFFYVADVGERLVDFADPGPGARVLDVGAGRGAVARAALARGCVVTAVDASARMVELLGADFPEITARQQDAGRLDFADGSFDLVTAGFVVQVLDDPAAAIAEIRRVLVPAGVFALSVERQSVGRLAWLHELNAEFFAGRPADATPPDPDPAPAATRPAGPLGDEDVAALLAGAGFVDLTRTSIDMPMPIADPAALWDWLTPRGLADALRRLPADRTAEFRRMFLAGAERMHADGGIVLDFGATLHRAHTSG